MGLPKRSLVENRIHGEASKKVHRPKRKGREVEIEVKGKLQSRLGLRSDEGQLRDRCQETTTKEEGAVVNVHQDVRVV